MRITKKAEEVYLGVEEEDYSILDEDPVLYALQRDWFDKAWKENEILSQRIPNNEAKEYAKVLHGHLEVLQGAIEKRISEVLLEDAGVS